MPWHFIFFPIFAVSKLKIRLRFRNIFSFPAPSLHTHTLPISKLILESCNKGCSSGQFHLQKKKQQLFCLRFALLFRAHLDFLFFGFVFLRGTAINCYVNAKPSWVFFRKLPSKTCRLSLPSWNTLPILPQQGVLVSELQAVCKDWNDSFMGKCQPPLLDKVFLGKIATIFL